ncbi:MAG: hypothetical protein JRJ38_16555 [Deltaproteobacteria bacterium]|nr:hypothetical protein [Deltaproteobacteria bacterium]
MKPTYEALEQWVKELEEKALEHKQAEANLQRHVAELERANQELKQFVYVMSRDLEEPLEIVMTYLRFVEARYKRDWIHWAMSTLI